MVQCFSTIDYRNVNNNMQYKYELSLDLIVCAAECVFLMLAQNSGINGYLQPISDNSSDNFLVHHAMRRDNEILLALRIFNENVLGFYLRI